ncbi:MAG: SDR family oxidoreductase [Candidatus Gastranaerophilales bacterium]|nr:SDR family oxidoreductase [Candidatus Gastranaerophilales bacterium]
MIILVTGGAGFIGSNLCRKLLEQEHKVYCLDNFYTGSKKNIEELLNNENFICLNHDICNSMSFIKVEQIYNLACPASPPAYQGFHSIETTKTCVIGSLNLLELAKKNNATILQASTSEIYGNPLEHPQKETYFGNVNINGPRSCYDEGKRCAETLFTDYNRLYNLDTKICRIFNTYGKYMSPDDGRVVTNFIKQALRDEDITIYGDGSQTRSFCYVDDLVNGMIKLMNSEYNKPVNLGNPEEYTIKQIAEIILEKIPQSKSKIVFKDLPQDDPVKRKPDITVAKQVLNWQPEIKLSDGLDKTIEYLKEVL